ncbi:MAG: CCA tRNA nucleotidyltransferase, partial [Candidatus Altiarchaeota archaeon]
MDELLREVLSRITPSKIEHENDLLFAGKLADYARGFGVEPMVVGSLAKGTDLAGNKDIDLFILFDEDTAWKTLEKEALEIGKAVFKKFKGEWEIDYAEHPYVKGRLSEFDVEIVPCYAGKSIKSSVDRTPFHTEYVSGKLKGNPKLSGEIRLLKQFMTGVGVYGAEAKVQGFSGYLAEIITIHYGSFKKVLKAASDWKVGKTLDSESLWDDAESLKYYFTDATLIIVDPVDRDRNVAAAVSTESLAKFILASKDFLKKPSKEFFFPKPKKPKSVQEIKKKMKERDTKILAITLKHGKINENTLYSQLRRTENSLVKTFEKNEFAIFKSGFWTNEKNTSLILLEFKVWELPKIMQHRGPPLELDAENQERFKSKHAKQKPYIKDGRWMADVKRRATTVEEILPEILKNREGFGKNLRKAKAKTAYDEKILVIKDKEYLIFLEELL